MAEREGVGERERERERERGKGRKRKSCDRHSFVCVQAQVRAYDDQGILAFDLERGMTAKMSASFMAFLCTLTDVGRACRNRQGCDAGLSPCSHRRAVHPYCIRPAQGKQLSGGMYEGKRVNLKSHVIVFSNEEPVACLWQSLLEGCEGCACVCVCVCVFACVGACES